MGHFWTDGRSGVLKGKRAPALASLAAVVLFIGLLFPGTSHAARTINSVTLNGAASVSVAASATITAVVNVTTDGIGTAARWRSTGWRISTSPPGAVTCVNHANHDGAGGYSETFSITAPASGGTYNAYFIAYNNDSCSSGASGTYTMAGAVTVTSTNPVPTTTSISPTSKNVGDATFTLTVNGTNFVSGSVVRFAGSDRTTTYVSATQLTATIPASDLTAVGNYSITVFNPTPGGGTSNAQTLAVVNPVPTTTSISPTSKNVGDATFTLTVNGTNFISDSVVQFAGSNRSTVYVSSTQLTATIPASDLTTVGTYAITVFTPTPGGGTSNAQTFTVNPGLPTATTNAATGVTSWVATVNGTVSSNGASTTVSFQYGLTTAYGYSVTATQSPLAANAANSAVSADLVGLNCNTTFHYRVVATNSAGTTYGADGTFTTGSCTAPYPATACAATRFGSDLNCTANDVNLTQIQKAPGSMSSCVSGAPVTLDLDLTVNFASPDRWDVGIFIANDGNSPDVLPTSGGASSCSVDILPITTPPSGDTFLDLDGVPQSTTDTCGDGNSSLNGTGNGVKRMTGVTLPCYASPSSGGKLYVPFVVSWDNQKSPIGSLCTSNLFPVPNTTSKCNVPAGTVSIDVVVLPKISKTNGGTTLNPGATTTYTVVILNDSGGTLLDTVFTDPVVTNLTVNSVSCAAAAGATCPTTTVAAMQGAGITIPSTSLPNNSYLTFTINATVSSGAVIGSLLRNTATATVGGSHSTSAYDEDEIVLAPTASKSFSSDTITEGATSQLTITFTNPTAFAVTGVSFTDTYPSGLANTASANGATTCGGTVTAANNGSSLALSGGTIPASGSCTVTVNVTSATAGSYTNSTGTVTSDSGNISAASGTLTVDAPVFGSFNACDEATGTNCTSTTTTTTSHITTKIAGSAFNLDIVALKSDGTRNTNYSNNVQVQLLDASNNGGPLDSYNCRSTWTVITTLSPNPAFSNTDNGLITVGPFTVPEAYREVRVKITNVGGSTRIGCSTDNFAIRPDRFVLVATDADWETAGTARTLNATGASSGPMHKAGRPFTLTATAVNASNVTTTNYSGTQTLVPSACSGTACPTTVASDLTFGIVTLVPGTASSSSGVLTWGSVTYSDVGAFNLTLQDTTFASVDASENLDSCAGSFICSTATAVGRFVPDHFSLSGVVQTRSDLLPATGSTFTYMDEPMRVTLTVTAYNASEGVTQYYAGTLAKLDAATLGTGANWFNTGCATGTQCMGLGALSGATGLSSRLAVDTASAGSAAPTSDWSGGIGTFTVFLRFSRPIAAAPDTTWGPFDTLNVGGAPQDGDGVTLPGPGSSDTAHRMDMDATTGNALASNPDGTNERRFILTTSVRYGRLRLLNAYGSELLPLRVPVRAEFWNGSAWLLNAIDSLTTLAPGNVAIGNCQGGLVSQCTGVGGTPNAGTVTPTLTSATVASGLTTLILTRPNCPGACPTGSFDLALNLANSGGANLDLSCIAWPNAPASTSAAQPWLQFAWCAGSLDPNARGTFGTPRSRNIYLRERY